MPDSISRQMEGPDWMGRPQNSDGFGPRHLFCPLLGCWLRSHAADFWSNDASLPGSLNELNLEGLRKASFLTCVELVELALQLFKLLPGLT